MLCGNRHSSRRPPVSSRIGICLGLELDMRLPDVECIELRVLPCPGGSSASQKQFVCLTKSCALYVNREGHAHAIEHCAFTGLRNCKGHCFVFCVSSICLDRRTCPIEQMAVSGSGHLSRMLKSFICLINFGLRAIEATPIYIVTHP